MINLEAAIDLVTIGRTTQLHLDTGIVSYPSLTFALKIDSKANIPLNIGSIVAHVYMTSAYMGKIQWIISENIFDQVHRIDEIQPLGETWINLRFTPPKDFLKSKHPRHWELKGVILFESKEGLLAPKIFSSKFKLEKWIYDKAIQTYYEIEE